MGIAHILVCAILYVPISCKFEYPDFENVRESFYDYEKKYEEGIQRCEARFETFADKIERRMTQQEDRIAAIMNSDCSCESKEATLGSKRQTFAVQTVAFTAQLSSDLYNITDYQPIIFDFVQTNIGNAYDAISGIFTTPTTGVFVFIWTTTNYNNHAFLQSELVVNGTVKGRQWSDSGLDDDVSSATGSLVLSLKSGEQVWIRTNTAHLSGTLKGGFMSSFSGWLLT